MENLKLISIRVSVNALDSANSIAKQLGCYNQSDVLRLAMWVGLKIANPRYTSALNSLMRREEAGLRVVNVEDVLRAAGVIEDNKSAGAL